MTSNISVVRRVQEAAAADAWPILFDAAWNCLSAPLKKETAGTDVANRDRATAPFDLLVSGACWNLWTGYPGNAERTSDKLVSWWSSQGSGKAVLILDALSLREAPWILDGAKSRGYNIHQCQATAAELPADTTPFAKALGFAQRSALENDGAGGSHRLPEAKTDSVDLPWEECIKVIGSEPNWVLWHAWPDDKLHELGTPGHGLRDLTNHVAGRLNSSGFWALIERLTTGRRLVITSDHGYSATGEFADTSDDDQAKHLKEVFGSRRWVPGKGNGSPWLPPIDLSLESRSGWQQFVLGRRKWKSPGGYPTLAHGGLSILEVAVPFIEISR